MINKIKNRWIYNEEQIVEYIKENANKYKSFSDFCKKFGASNSSFQKSFSKKYRDLINSLDWNYSKNNSQYNPIYQDYNWLYQKYMVDGLSHKKIAEEAGCTTRVIKKWLSEKNNLTQEYRLENFDINKTQEKLIIGSILGDGHIDKREGQSLFIVSHSEKQKDYLYWKYDIMKNMCNKKPSIIKEKVKTIKGKEHTSRKAYRISTRIVRKLSKFKEMSSFELIDLLDELSFSVFLLDDACRGKSCLWSLCVASFSNTEKEYMIKVFEDKFNIKGMIKKDDRYISFTRSDSIKIDDIILKNIPNDLDIIKYKIINRKRKRAFKNIIIKDNIKYTTKEFGEKFGYNGTTLATWIKDGKFKKKVGMDDVILEKEFIEVRK